MGRCPSGQRELTVNQPARPTEVRILPGPPHDRQVLRAWRSSLSEPPIGHPLIRMIVIDAEGLAASRPNRPLFAGRLAHHHRRRPGRRRRHQRLRQEHAAADARPRARARGRRGALGPWRACRVPRCSSRVLPEGTVRDAVGGTAGRARRCSTAWAWPSWSTPAPTSCPAGRPSGWRSPGCSSGEYEALILDEPTNHLDLDAIAFLEDWLAAYRGGLVLVTHDRHVLDRVTTKVLEIDRGTAYLHVPRAGTPVRATPRTSPVGPSARSGPRRPRRSARTWPRRNWPGCAAARRPAPPSPRRASPRPRRSCRARPQAAARERRPRAVDGLAAARLEGHRGARRVVRVARRVARCSTGVDVAFEPGDRIGIVGPNGAGKSTLLDLVAGRLQPTAGAVERGATVKIGYYDQLGRDLDLTQRVREAVAGDKGEPSRGRRHPDEAVLVRRRRPVRARSARSAAASAAACSCCSRWCSSRTCCCSTSPPTTSTSTRCVRWRTSSTTGRASSSPSATTGRSSTGSPTSCSHSTAVAERRGSAAAWPPGWPQREQAARAAPDRVVDGDAGAARAADAEADAAKPRRPQPVHGAASAGPGRTRPGDCHRPSVEADRRRAARRRRPS